MPEERTLTENNKDSSCAARQNAEKRYQAFLKFLPIPLLVHNLDQSVAYMNPAFEETFGWDMADLDLDPFAPIPQNQVRTTRTGKVSLLTNGVFYGKETQRLTKDGRVLDVIYDGSALYDEDNRPDGLVVTLRDITQAKRDARTSQALFEIANALHQYSDLDGCLHFVTHRVRQLMDVQQAYIVLVDADYRACYFKADNTDEKNTVDASCIRVSLDSGALGQIIETGEAVVINHVGDDEAIDAWPFDMAAGGPRNLLGVPMRLEDRTIGVIIAAERINGDFDSADVHALGSIANLVSLPIENTRMHEELLNSYEAIKSLNRAKDRLIDHLSHELRTPISVLSATFKILQEGDDLDPGAKKRIFDRSERNLQRIIDMQAKLKDIVDAPDRSTSAPLDRMLDLCLDDLEVAADVEGGAELGTRIRRHIDAFFNPPSRTMTRIDLGEFTIKTLASLASPLADRRVELITDIPGDAGTVVLPSDVLSAIVVGLVRNAVEYTPDGGRVSIVVRAESAGPVLMVSDTGIGITEENQQLIAGSYFTTADMYQYRTGTPFHFNAGGRGLDLLRLRVFSQRYGFSLSLQSERCVHIPTHADVCPGDTQQCTYCDSPDHCHQTGGSTFTVRFQNVVTPSSQEALDER